MILIWRGWGVLTFFIPLFMWFGLLFGVLLGTNYHQPDAEKAAAMICRLSAASLILSAVILFAIGAYRERVAPGVDLFIFTPVKYWHWLFVVGAVALFVLSFFPRLFA